MIQGILDLLGTMSGYKQCYEASEETLTTLIEENEILNVVARNLRTDNAYLQKYMPERWLPKAEVVGILSLEQVRAICTGDFRFLDMEHQDMAEESWAIFMQHMRAIRPTYISNLRDCENFTILVWSMCNRYCPGAPIGYANLAIPGPEGLMPHWANPLIMNGELWFIDLVNRPVRGIMPLPNDWILKQYAL